MLAHRVALQSFIDCKLVKLRDALCCRTADLDDVLFLPWRLRRD